MMKISRFVIGVAIVLMLIGMALTGGALAYGKRQPSEQVVFLDRDDNNVISRDISNLYLFDIARNLAIRVFDDANIAQPLWTPNGSYLVFYRAFQIFSMDSSNGRIFPVTGHLNWDFVDRNTTLSPDSESAIFTINGRPELISVEVLSIPRVISEIYVPTTNIAWSPDSARIAIWGIEDKEIDIHIYDIALGTHQRMFVERNFTSPQLHWFDNSTLVVVSGGLNIRYIDVQTRRLREVIINNGANNEDWQWSPDGTQIAFTLDDPKGGVAIYTMDVLGRNQRRLTDAFLEIRDLTWTPDGTRIAFVSDGALYTVSVGDEPLVTLITDNYNIAYPAWRP